jgi:hypothetical protein
MKVRLVRDSLEGCPLELAHSDYVGDTEGLLLGEIYDVYAVAIFERYPIFQLIPAPLGEYRRNPFWYNSWYFEIVDAICPSDWICTFFNDVGGDNSSRGVSLILAPPFIAKSVDAYVDMIESVPQSVSEFWKRWESLQPRPE